MVEMFTPTIRNYKERVAWSKRNQSPYVTTLAFYNTGWGLFRDPRNDPAYSFYEDPWQHVSFMVHHEPHYILVSPRKFGGLLDDVVLFQTLGHTPLGNHVTIRIGTIWDGKDWVIAPSPMAIPPQCILYVAVRTGHVKDQLLVFQPLPTALMINRGPGLQTLPKQYITAVK